MCAATIYDQVRQMIVQNEIPPGAKINIDALVRALGVSQTPVREALHHLEGDGLVARAKGKGYFTTDLLDEQQFRNMFEVRMLLEPWSARVLATDRMSNPGAKLLELVDDVLSIPKITRNDLALHDEAFHRVLQRATGNSFLADAFEGLHPQLHLFRLYRDHADKEDIILEHAEVTALEHRGIALAIQQCEPAKAEQNMRDHLLNSFKRFEPEQRRGNTPTSDGLDMPRSRVIG